MKKNQTLAEFISSRRENIGLSQRGLCAKSNLDINIIERVESGQDLFLSTTVRQKLAKGLKVEAKIIKSLEKSPEERIISEDAIEEIKFNILEGKLEGNICPVCGRGLICRISNMFDLENNPVSHPKARCSSCPFQIR